MSDNPDPADYAIVSVGVEQLYNTTKELLEYRIKNILVEKPGALYSEELKKLKNLAKQSSSKVFIAYNRRFYSSVLKAKEIIAADGGVTSFNFEFTEWTHTIDCLEKGKGVKENWFISNSSHVSDLAFYLGGIPKKIAAFNSGKNFIKWHPSSSVFSGSGISETGALFSYQANWGAPGRWSVEILTSANRLIFRPMEKLQIQKLKSVAIEPVELDDKIDVDFKPGLYKQTEFFLEGKTREFCTLSEQQRLLKIYRKIAGY